MAIRRTNSCSDLPLSKQRSRHWVISQEIPADVVVEVGEEHFPLHKVMLVSKSNYIRRLILESKDTDLARIELSVMPGGPEIFETVVKFCYGVDFEITVQNVAALWCAAEYLQMNEKYSENNLTSRSESFLSEVALTSLSGAILVLKSCEDLLPVAEELNLVQRCVEVISSKACVEAKFPSRSPSNWWIKELLILDVTFFGKIMDSMKGRGAKALTMSSCLMTYTERSLHDHVRDHSGNGIKSLNSGESDIRIQKQREVLESIVTLLPSETLSFPPNFLCFLLRAAIFLRADAHSTKDLEKRISAILDHAKVDDLFVLSCTYDGERLSDLETVRRIISGFVDKENSIAVFNAGDLREVCSVAMKRVAKTVDGYLAEIATYGELTVSRFNGIANLLPKAARKVDDDLYRAVDIYLKAHANLDEIEREKVCGVMDICRLSYEARVHASRNKRLPVPKAMQALCYDQLELRSSIEFKKTEDAWTKRDPTHDDVSLAEENELLRMELLEMKIYLSDVQKNLQGTSTPDEKVKKQTSVSEKLRKLNILKKDTSDGDGGKEGSAKPKKSFYRCLCRDI
ncbi:root phototropism protein 2-like [Primulina huaijiensis]|uniref:root phototropism protein 2-like n=1 Tax=Primulina huaijiensis TaxID=1492673 RepID=UPI003CC772F3